MLIRILADNPGATFTRNIDKKFVETVRDLLRNARDPSVQQIMRETLHSLYTEKAYDTNMSNLFSMWGKESGLGTQRPPPNAAWQQLQQQQERAWNRGATQNQPPALPPPVELAARIEEARTSAKLLQQLVQMTPPNELQSHELVKEFAERCQTAQRSMQGYINSENPHPDDDTMQTLIETSEQLSVAASKHQRALLQARRATAAVTLPQRNDAINGMPPIPQAAVPLLSKPTLPIRKNQNSTPPTSTAFVPQREPPQPATPQSTTPQPAPPEHFNDSPPLSNYSPPPAPPPGMQDRLERRISGQGIPQGSPGHVRSPSSPNSLYSEQVFAPSPERRRSEYDPYRADSPSLNAPIPALPGRSGFGVPRDQPSQAPLPPTNKPTTAIELPSPGYGNPFSDTAHKVPDAATAYDDEDDPTATLYRLPGGGPTSMTARVAAALAAGRAGAKRDSNSSGSFGGGSGSGSGSGSGGDGSSNANMMPAHPQLRPPPPTGPEPSFTGDQASYHPGYHTTPSYRARQDSALKGLSMRGAVGIQEEPAEGTGP